MKEIKDYLHLYLGCQLERGGFVTANLLHEAETAAFDIWADLKPVLRPLSDMSEEEQEEHDNFEDSFYETYDGSEENNQSRKYATWAAESTRWCLSKHFDLFGLIEAGLAIDKTTF